MSLIASIDQSALANWVRDTIWVYPLMLTLHAVGLAFAAGLSVALDLRVLGVAPALPMQPWSRVRPVFYAALAVNAISGVFLVLNNPAKWLVDPLFYTKLSLLVLALINAELLARRLFGAVAGTATRIAASTRGLAVSSLMLWASAVTAGRLLAYSYFR
jgi:hypothetical protein